MTYRTMSGIQWAPDKNKHLHESDGSKMEENVKENALYMTRDELLSQYKTSMFLNYDI